MLASLLLCFSFFSKAQTTKTAIVKGRLINSYTKAPLNGVTVTVPGSKTYTVTDGNGRFNLSRVPQGKQAIIISGPEAQSDTISINVTSGVNDLNDISVTPANANTEIPLIFIDDNADPDDDDDAGLYVANDDPFLNNTWNARLSLRFKPRGFRNRETQVNGIPLIDYERGFDTWGAMGGLNNVLRSQHGTYGLQPSEYAFGSVTGVNYIDAAAIDQRKGTNVSYYTGNRVYRNRVMITHSSGLSQKGWAYSLSASRRWAKEGYVDGTFYDAFSLYGSISKRLKKGMFSFTGFVTPTKRGRASYLTQEMFDLGGGNRFNPAWGYQNGEKRNSGVTDIFQPLLIANYVHQPSDRLRWNTAIGYNFGKYKSSTIDFYNAYNPYGTFYRNMPSYYRTLRPPFHAIADMVEAQLRANPDLMQVQWDNLYNQNYANTETIHDVNGIPGNDVTGRRSLYILSNYVNDLQKFSFNTSLEYYKDEHITFYGGLTSTYQSNRNYRQAVDLLGGDFFVNYNQFAAQHVTVSQSIIQNDLNSPNKLIRVGDKYGYDYRTSIISSDIWGQAAFVYNKFDLFAAADLGYVSFTREGFMKNGLFPNNSYGKSAAHNFFTYKVKGGATYNLNMRNYIYLNAEYRQEAPLIANTYISVRTRDYTVNNPTTFSTKTVEGGYVLKTPSFHARIAGYVSDINNSTSILRFFNDDPDIQSFVNMVLVGVNERSIGTELTGSYKITNELSVMGVAALGQRFYTSRPTAVIYQDNDPTLTTKEHKVYVANYYSNQSRTQRQGPQSIYTLGVKYSSPAYWFANVNFNYMDNAYVDINPERRTTLAADTLKRGSQGWNEVYDQEKLPAVFTIDVYCGKSFNLSHYFKKLPGRTLLVLSVSVANLLDKKDIKVAGYEQLRYDYAGRNPDRFPNMYQYGWGRNYSASISLRF